jgi:hypothetical protein
MKNELRILLRMLPTRILREVAYKKQIRVKARRKDDLIAALVEKGDFDDEDIKGLKDLIKILKEESEPVAQYILRFSKINLPDLKSKLESMPAQFGDSGELVSEGYEILEYKEDELLRARR